MTKRVEKLIRKYAKSLGGDRKKLKENIDLVTRTYLRGSVTQRKIDEIAFIATLFYKEKIKLGELQVDERGQILDQEQFKKVDTEFREKYKNIMPEFFNKPLTQKMEDSIIKTDKPKQSGEIQPA